MILWNRTALHHFIDTQREFFRVKWYKNGMGHFEFLDPELVLKLNKVLALRYPAALAHVR